MTGEELIARLRAHADTQIDDNLAYIKTADDLMRAAADRLAAANAELATLRGINANLMGDDENVPRYTMKRMKQEVERRLAAANARAKTRELSDWSDLPKDLYVVSVKSGGGIVFDVTMCSVPMAIGPEVRYTRAEAAEARIAKLTSELDGGNAGSPNGTD